MKAAAPLVFTLLLASSLGLGVNTQQPEQGDDPMLKYVVDANEAYLAANDAKKAEDYCAFVQYMTIYRARTAGTLPEDDWKKIDAAIEEAKGLLRQRLWIPSDPKPRIGISTGVGINIVPSRPFDLNLENQLDLNRPSEIQDLQNRVFELERLNTETGTVRE